MLSGLEPYNLSYGLQTTYWCVFNKQNMLSAPKWIYSTLLSLTIFGLNSFACKFISLLCSSVQRGFLYLIIMWWKNVCLRFDLVKFKMCPEVGNLGRRYANSQIMLLIWVRSKLAIWLTSCYVWLRHVWLQHHVKHFLHATHDWELTSDGWVYYKSNGGWGFSLPLSL